MVGMMDAIRPEIPGEVWRFDAFEAHCFRMDFYRVRQFFDSDDAHIQTWLTAFEVEAFESGIEARGRALQVTPTEWDRAFFEAFVAHAMRHLTLLPPRPDEDDCILPCGHAAGEHLQAFFGWRERELMRPKKFALTLQRVSELPVNERLVGPPMIAREEIEHLVEEHIDRLKASLREGDRHAEEDYDANAECMAREAATYGLDANEAHKRFLAAQRRAREMTLRDARQQLRDLIERHYRILEPPHR